MTIPLNSMTPFASGNTCEVFDWPDGRVLKLFRDWVSDRHIIHEHHMVGLAHEAGLTILPPPETIRLDGRSGVLYQKIKGARLEDNLRRKPWRLLSLARQFAHHHALLHQQPAPQKFPPLNMEFKRHIEQSDQVPDNIRGALMARLERLAPGNSLEPINRVCHCDFTLRNLMIDHQGHWQLIDWVSAAKGPPEADVALTWLNLLSAARGAPQRPWWERMTMELFARTYLRHYLRHNPHSRDTIWQWLPLAASLLCRNRQCSLLETLANPAALQHNRAIRRFFQ
jgi:thiamine kinase